MTLFTPDQLTERAAGVLRSVGTPAEIAARVAAILVNADLVGHSSWRRTPAELSGGGLQGKVAPAERPKTIRETAATAALDARRGWGHFAADTAMRIAIAKAKSTGSEWCRSCAARTSGDWANTPRWRPARAASDS